ncbi:SGNH/GDSL hydrolase family protein [uncultured Microscilla sp.]|uniref:SGNH/GDSL hydrolase family protein n=1 Tax=uncultured Microscilla sp. TaxID=432653 RepID=UPI002629830A|nr:SGNH/GDSL hydrolase family protein [uncultured Microscilla sp.]
MYFALFLLLLVAVPLGIFIYLYRLVQSLPLNHPVAFLEELEPGDGRQIVVCAGDDLTQGNMGANYVDILEDKLDQRLYHVVNAGVNGDLSEHLVNRLDEIIACNPTHVVLLIGTNDLNAMLDDKNMATYRQLKKISEKPLTDQYRENVSLIIEALKMRSRARVAIMSIPLIGEKLNDKANAQTQAYAEIIEQLAAFHKITYLPLQEKQRAFLTKTKFSPKRKYKPTTRLVATTMFRRYILGQSFDKIAALNGFLMTPDYLHLNTFGANMVAGLIADFVEGRT